MRQTPVRYENRQKTGKFEYEVFEARHLSPRSSRPTYAGIAAQLQVPAPQVARWLDRSRRRFARIVRGELAHSMHATANVDDEIRELMGLLG